LLFCDAKVAGGQSWHWLSGQRRLSHLPSWSWFVERAQGVPRDFMLLWGKLHFKWMGTVVGEENFVARSPSDLPNFSLFFCEPSNHSAGLPITPNRKEMNMPSSFQLANVPWWGQTWLCLFSLGNKSCMKSLLFRLRTTLLIFKSQWDCQLNLGMWISTLPGKDKGLPKLPKSWQDLPEIPGK
jgi:hypothetical protein